MLEESGDPVTGTLRGVVFADQGVGTANMDTRLPGATLAVVGAGAAIGGVLWAMGAGE